MSIFSAQFYNFGKKRLKRFARIFTVAYDTSHRLKIEEVDTGHRTFSQGKSVFEKIFGFQKIYEYDRLRIVAIKIARKPTEC